MNWRSSTALVGLLLLLGAAAHAEYPDAQLGDLDRVTRLYLDQAIALDDDRRGLDLHLRAETRYGEPVETLRAVDLAILDNGERVDPEKIELQQLSETGAGADAVIVIDRSQRTLANEAFARAREALARVVAASAAEDRVAVVSFASSPTLESDFDATKIELASSVEQLETEPAAAEASSLYDAIGLALDTLRNRELATRRGFVIVFTGSGDEGSSTSLEALIERGRGGEFDGRIPVFTIGYAADGDAPAAALQALSEGTAAKSFQARSPIHLASLFLEIWRQMAHSYVAFYPARLDGEIHKIEISVEGHSDMRMVDYPSSRTTVYAWWVGGGLALAAASFVGYRVKRRNRLMGRLVFVGGQESGREVILRGPDVRIGALPDNDIVVGSGAVSRQHAIVRLRGPGVEIEDLETRNGTYVNGTPITTATLKSGDKIRIADVDMVYEK